MVNIQFPQKSSFGTLTATKIVCAALDTPAGDMVLSRGGSARLTLSSALVTTHRNLQLDSNRSLVDDASNVLLDPDDAGGITSLADVANAPTFNGIAVTEGPLVGAANKWWQACIFSFDAAERTYLTETSPVVLTNPTSGEWKPVFQVPMPCMIAAKKLYITGIRVDLDDADGSNYVDSVEMYGKKASGEDWIKNLPTDLDTIDTHEQTFAAIDCSAYRGIIVMLDCEIATASTLDVNSVEVQCYYA